VKETDALFRHLQATHRQAAGAEDTLRISIDAKAPVLIGPFSRGGKSRQGNRGADHDFKPWGRLTPFGIFLPDQKDLSLFFTASKVTSDFMVDRLGQWWQANRESHPKVRRWLLDLDNGPENHSRRTQFIYRLVQLAQATQVTIVLVYYPPYHSKYNPIERCWSALEQKWGGVLLNGLKVVLQCALRMRWKGRHPTVKRLHGEYPDGVRVADKEMKGYESRLERSATLPKYDITIKPRDAERQVN